MIAWLSILIPSIIVGIICGYFLRYWLGLIIAGALPWLGLLAFLLYDEYFVPYQGGGASMWPIAQLFGGTIAAATGMCSYSLSRYILTSILNKENS
jgi:hypothetical protein